MNTNRGFIHNNYFEDILVGHELNLHKCERGANHSWKCPSGQKRENSIKIDPIISFKIQGIAHIIWIEESNNLV